MSSVLVIDFPNPPFNISDKDIIYVESVYNFFENDFIQKNYEKICNKFLEKGYRFIYLPKLSDDLKYEMVRKISMDYNNTTLGNINIELQSSFLLDCLNYGDNDYYEASLLFKASRYYDSWYFILNLKEVLDCFNSIDLSECLKAVVDIKDKELLSNNNEEFYSDDEDYENTNSFIEETDKKELELIDVINEYIEQLNKIEEKQSLVIWYLAKGESDDFDHEDWKKEFMNKRFKGKRIQRNEKNILITNILRTITRLNNHINFDDPWSFYSLKKGIREIEKYSNIKVTKRSIIKLTDYNIELKFNPLFKVFYLFFLNHMQDNNFSGITYEDIDSIDEELKEWFRLSYKGSKSTYKKDFERIIESIENKKDYLKFSILISKINKELKNILGEKVSPKYQIVHPINEGYKIVNGEFNVFFELTNSKTKKNPK